MRIKVLGIAWNCQFQHSSGCKFQVELELPMAAMREITPYRSNSIAPAQTWTRQTRKQVLGERTGSPGGQQTDHDQK